MLCIYPRFRNELKIGASCVHENVGILLGTYPLIATKCNTYKNDDVTITLVIGILVMLRDIKFWCFINNSMVN